MQLYLNTEFGQRVQRRLNEDRIIWLTTVDASNRPQVRPVWFLWDGERFLIYSRPNTAKLQHIQYNPQVSLNLDGDGLGGDIVVFNGTAQIDDQPVSDEQVTTYVAKYESGMQRIGMTREQFAQVYSKVLRVTPTSLRGH